MDERVIFVTVNFTLRVPELNPVLVTVQTPLEFVTQVTVPDAPFDHLPVTVALATAPSDELWTVIVTVAFHFVPEAAEVRSRSPMCMVAGAAVNVGVGVRVLVGAAVKVAAGDEVNVKVGKGVRVLVGNAVNVKVGNGVDVSIGAVVGVRVGSAVSVKMGRTVLVSVGVSIRVEVGTIAVAVGAAKSQLKAASRSRRPYPYTLSGPAVPKSAAELIRASC